MTVSSLVFHTDEFTAADIAGSDIHVRLYGTSQLGRTGHIGNQLLGAVERLAAPTSVRAFDFLSLAMAVTSADTFVRRTRMADDAWARNFKLRVPLASPTEWEPVKDRLERVLHFLTGDIWKFELVDGGLTPPNPNSSRKKKQNSFEDVDLVSLFSGGLDSWIGVSELLNEDRKPILVSHSYSKDSLYQDRRFRGFGGRAERFYANASPIGRAFEGGSDTTMRSRSFNFIAYAVIVAEALRRAEESSSPVDILLPENGFIALNAPLTARRVGSLSTRTTHPFFVSELQSILQEVGIQVNLTNPYRHMTKGEMLSGLRLSATDAPAAVDTVSCGKWKRNNKQCGRCVPCIIRRSAFHAAGIDDTTDYGDDLNEDLLSVKGKNDDLMSMIKACQITDRATARRLALQAGPMPLEEAERDRWFSVHWNGLMEVKSYLRSVGLVT